MLPIYNINSYTFRMRDLLENQFHNVFLWVPFLMAFGAGLYFTLPMEPHLGFPGIFAAILFALMFIKRIPLLARGIVIFAFGFFYAAAFTHFISTPQLTRDVRNMDITAHVMKIDYTDSRARIYMKLNSDQIGANGKTAIIRVSMGDDMPVPEIGDTVRATVNLFRPALPDAPGTFDYARWAYFNHLTATGYLTDIHVINHHNYPNINAMREYLHRRTNSFLADSLVLGYKNSVPKEESKIWTATGIGHVWSISGFHMTLVSGWLFGFFYLIFRLIAPITRRVPARIPAMICAWFGLLFYLFLSGIDVATIRAFLMTTLIFAAFIFSRNAISMRNVCVAFCIIFLMNPHYIMQAGFQLSFSAIFGLVWFWGTVKPKMPNNKVMKFITATILTSVVATIFTAPFVIAHFGTMPMYGLIGNLILLPIFSVAIMPLVMIGTITAVLGWHGPLIMADTIYNFTLHIAHKIATLPGATIPMPHIPNSAMCFIILGFLALMFIRTNRSRTNYILFGVFITIAGIIIATSAKPVFYATYDHELVGFYDNGELTFNKSRAANHYFAFGTWKQLNGLAPETPNRRRPHDNGVYIYKTENFNLAYIQKFVPLKNNIARLCNDDNIDYIVSYFQINSEKCNHKILNGGLVIYKSGRINYIKTNRYWHNPRP